MKHYRFHYVYHPMCLFKVIELLCSVEGLVQVFQSTPAERERIFRERPARHFPGPGRLFGTTGKSDRFQSFQKSTDSLIKLIWRCYLSFSARFTEFSLAEESVPAVNCQCLASLFQSLAGYDKRPSISILCLFLIYAFDAKWQFSDATMIGGIRFAAPDIR